MCLKTKIKPLARYQTHLGLHLLIAINSYEEICVQFNSSLFIFRSAVTHIKNALIHALPIKFQAGLRKMH